MGDQTKLMTRKDDKNSSIKLNKMKQRELISIIKKV